MGTSFVRCHINYCNIVWGAKKTSNLSELKTTTKRIWKKIGPFTQHTNVRLFNNSILKLEDEVALSEAKFIWKWNKQQVPIGVQPLIKEKNQRSFRCRKFYRHPKWKLDSLSSRLAIRANNEMSYLEKFNTKQTFKKHSKIKLLEKYNPECRIRNCLICATARINTQ